MLVRRKSENVMAYFATPLRDGEPCPSCGKPLERGRARSVLTLFVKCEWLRCSSGMECGFARPAFLADWMHMNGRKTGEG